MSEKQDVYRRITDKIVADLEKGIEPWPQPWQAAHVAGREYPHALGDGHEKELCLPNLADLQTGAGDWRARPQRKEKG